MFKILDMDKSSNQTSPSKQIRTTATSTVSEPPPEKQNLPILQDSDIIDYIPIENNAKDFDLRQIIDTVAQENIDRQTNQIVQKPPTNALTDMTNVTVPNTAVTTINQNISNTQQLSSPFVPRMVFPHSNVTINYIFSK